MRTAIFSDVHSNWEALTSVLAQFKKSRVEAACCLGDIVGYGANPRECLAKVREVAGVIVAGNHDWAAGGKFDLSWFNPTAAEAVRWTQTILTEEDKQFLRSLSLLFVGEEFTLAHGCLDKPEEFEYVYDPQSAAGSLKALRTPLGFVGHSHLPMIYTLKESRVGVVDSEKMALQRELPTLVNVGSVGQPRDGDPRACFCVYDSGERTVEFVRVLYDVETAQRKILRSGLPPIFAQRLAVGR